jgi:hypothetical protein
MQPYFQTPCTALTWATLEEWLDCARKIDRRRASALRNRQAELHVSVLPITVVYQCSSRATLASCHKLLRRGPTHFCQPPRGQRQNGTSALFGHRYPTSWTKHERARLAGSPLRLRWLPFQGHRLTPPEGAIS